MSIRPRKIVSDIPLKRENLFEACLEDKRPSTFRGVYSQGTEDSGTVRTEVSQQPIPIKKMRKIDIE